VGNINSYSDKGDILISAEASSFELGCVWGEVVYFFLSGALHPVQWIGFAVVDMRIFV
jgi:hypothetical protein